MRERGPSGQAAGLCRLPLVDPEEWVQTREGKSLLDKNDLLMEDAETTKATSNRHPNLRDKFSLKGSLYRSERCGAVAGARAFFTSSACCIIHWTVISGTAGSQPSRLACSTRASVINPGAIVTGSGVDERYTIPSM